MHKNDWEKNDESWKKKQGMNEMGEENPGNNEKDDSLNA